MFPSGRIVDLSVPVTSGAASAPPQGRTTTIEKYTKPGKEHFQGSWISTSAHIGSHVDSPLHVVKDGPAIGEIPLAGTMGEAVVLNLSPIDANQSIEPRHLEPHASRVRANDILILRTDWSDRKWGVVEFWTESPYLTEDSARWLAARKPKAIAFDFFEEYIGRFKDFTSDQMIVHLILLKQHRITLIENITNLGSLQKERVLFFAAPMKIMETEGAPARVFAIEPE